jgi:hypothetical protein
MLHDLPDTASTLQNRTSEVKKPEVAAKRNGLRERESSHRSFSEDAEMLSNDKATVMASEGEQQPLH